jgi:uncharacterized repeat protein (TIGR03803 family)
VTTRLQRFGWISKVVSRARKATPTLMLAFAAAASRSAQGQTFTVLHTFHGLDGAASSAGLIRDSAGNLYGTTVYGGASSNGTVFKLDTTLTETVLHSFTGGADGANPYAPLVADAKGNKYAVAHSGGDLNCASPYGCGTVYKVGSTGNFSVLHTFAGSDGYWPAAGLLRQSGNLYGVTTGGGATNSGTVFKVKASGQTSVLYSFAGPHPSGDGSGGYGRLVRDTSGAFYGTTYNGGIVNQTTCQIIGCGTVFKLTPTQSGWTETVLYRFTGGADGGYPGSTLVLDSQGNLYGTTTVGGSGNCTVGCGVVFKLTQKSGQWTETVVHAFSGGFDGAFPGGELVRDAAGNFYGPAYYGGNLNCSGPKGCGVIFKLDTAGKVTALHTFTVPDGVGPNGGLLINQAKRTLDGTTSYGGDTSCSTLYGQGCGTVFQLTY